MGGRAPPSDCQISVSSISAAEPNRPFGRRRHGKGRGEGRAHEQVGWDAQVSVSLFWSPAGVSLAGGFRQKALWTRRHSDMLETEAVGVEIYKQT